MGDFGDKWTRQWCWSLFGLDSSHGHIGESVICHHILKMLRIEINFHSQSLKESFTDLKYNSNTQDRHRVAKDSLKDSLKQAYMAYKSRLNMKLKFID